MRQIEGRKETYNIQRGAKVGAPGSVNMRRKIAFSCLLQAEERNFLPHIHGTRSADFSPPLYIVPLSPELPREAFLSASLSHLSLSLSLPLSIKCSLLGHLHHWGKCRLWRLHAANNGAIVNATAIAAIVSNGGRKEGRRRRRCHSHTLS